MTKINKNCFMWEILSQVDRENFNTFTFDDKHIAWYSYNYHYDIITTGENVYISVKAYSRNEGDHEVANICIKNYTGEIDSTVFKAIQEIDRAIKEYWNNYWQITE